jgi:hypothetical protein
LIIIGTYEPDKLSVGKKNKFFIYLSGKLHSYEKTRICTVYTNDLLIASAGARPERAHG